MGKIAALPICSWDELPRKPISGSSRVMEILRSPARSKLQLLVTNSCYICDYSPLDLGQKWCLAGPMPIGPEPHGGDCYGELPRIRLTRSPSKGEGAGLVVYTAEMKRYRTCRTTATRKKRKPATE